MKNMRKLASLLLALVMVFAMATTAFADEAPTTGTIKITNATSGQTYSVYKLFDAEVAFDEDGEFVGVLYTLPDGKSLDDNKWFELKDGYVTAKDGVTNDDIAKEEFKDWAKSFGTAAGSKEADSETVEFTGLDFGYYFIDSTLGANVTVNSATPVVEVVDKNNPPEMDKDITAINNDTSDTSITDDGDAAHVQVGDVVTYTVTITAKTGAENYVFTDTLSDGLTLDITSVKVDNEAYATSSKVDASKSSATGNVITITFAENYLDTIEKDTEIKISYNATVNENAVIGEAGNANDAELEYGHKPTTITDDVKVYSAVISVVKKDGQEQPLAGATFVLKNGENKYYKWNDTDKKVEWVDAEDDATKVTSDGNLETNEMTFNGLTDGTYTLVETVVPAGYNPTEDNTKITIENGKYTDANLKQSATVVNNTGSTLPSTGGMGTTLFYIVGGILVVAAVVLLVTKKRMTVAE